MGIAYTDQASAAAARTSRADDPSTPIIFVHGFDGSLTTCPGFEIANGSNFGSIVNYFKTQPVRNDGGWTGTMDEVLFYAEDTANTNLADGHVSHNIDLSYRPGASETEYFGSTGHTTCGGAGAPDLNENADIRHIAYHLAWYIYNAYTSMGASVDIIDHSMGGLIVRWMLYAEQNNTSSGPGQGLFPPALDVSNVMDVSAPNNGTPLGCAAFFLIEGQQMCPGSSFLSAINTGTGFYPQGTGGTAWTTMGSNGGDTVVGYTSATYMGAPVHKIVYERPTTYTHGGYLTDQVTTKTDTISTCPSTCPQGTPDTGYPNYRITGYHSIREMSRALKGDLSTKRV